MFSMSACEDLLDDNPSNDPNNPDNPNIEVKKTGWHLTNYEFIDGNRKTEGSFWDGGKYYDIFEAVGEKNEMTVTFKRTDLKGEVLSFDSNSCLDKYTVKWTDPPAYFSDKELPSVNVDAILVHKWSGGHRFAVGFDDPSINPGFTSGNKVHFKTPNDETSVNNFKGEMKAPNIPKGKVGEKRTVMASFGWSAYKYHYEWKEYN